MNRTKLDKLIDQTKKEHGKNIFEIPKSINSWGYKSINDVLGGLPTHIVELFGPEGGGKSTLAYKALAEAQKCGKTGLLLDAEFSYSKEYADALGINTETLLVIKENIMEDVLKLANRFLSVEEIGVVVIDSLPALIPRVVHKTVIEKEKFDKRFIAERARLLSEVLNGLVGQCYKHKTSLIVINQLREKAGMVFGNPETTPGGKAIKHFSMQRVDVRPKSKITDKNDNVVGRMVQIKAVKNKIKPPEVIIEMELIYGKGFIEKEEK